MKTVKFKIENATTGIQRADIWSKGGKSRIIFTQAHHERAVSVLSDSYFLTAITSEESK